jgi:hypothetical protein
MVHLRRNEVVYGAPNFFAENLRDVPLSFCKTYGMILGSKCHAFHAYMKNMTLGLVKNEECLKYRAGKGRQRIDYEEINRRKYPKNVFRLFC